MKRYLYSPYKKALTVGLFVSGLMNAHALITDMSQSLDATTALSVDASTSLKVRGDASLQATSTESTSSASFTTMGSTSADSSTGIVFPGIITATSDFELYKQGLVRADSHISSIETNTPGKMSVSWKQDGKLLAFIPVTVTSKTTLEANEDGAIKVDTDMPWWSIFVTGIASPTDDDEKRVESSEAVKAYAQATTDLTAQAEALYAVVTELQLDASIEGDATLESDMH